MEGQSGGAGSGNNSSDFVRKLYKYASLTPNIRIQED